MKKSSFAALVLGTISGVFFALGMCMIMLLAWNVFKPGILIGLVGIVLLICLIPVCKGLK